MIEAAPCDHHWLLDKRYQSWRHYTGIENEPGVILVVEDPDDMPRQYFEVREFHCAKCRECIRDEVA